MKKVLNMRVAIVLVALTLITSCFVGGTLAKYVTEGKGEDTARVAKFGVVVEGTGAAFSEEYEKDDDTFDLDDNTVVSSVKVVAPGTGGSLAAFTITGTPEVAVNVAFTGAVNFGENWVYNDGTEDFEDDYYCPIEITVGTEVLKGTAYADIQEFEAAIKAAIDAYTKDYVAGTDLSLIDEDDVPAISWAWAFEDDDNDDVKDTYLGDQAADDKAATIEIEVTVTVTQID